MLKSSVFYFITAHIISIILKKHGIVSDQFAVALVTINIAYWWITARIPMGVSSLLPMALFPLYGIMSGKQTAAFYMNNILMIFIGGFLVAAAMQKWDLHKRIALSILDKVGGSPRRVLLAFIAISGFLSMWISNTATTIMMVSIAVALIINLEEKISDKKQIDSFAMAVLLGICYAANVGGMATIVGTPTNLVFVKVYNDITGVDFAFLNWLILGFPVSLCLIIAISLWLDYVFIRKSKLQEIDTTHIKEELKSLGIMSFEQKSVALVFTAMALMWMFRKTLVIGDFTLYGWSELFSMPKYVDDGMVAVLCAVILFMVPTKKNDGMILESSDLKGIPWETILLFGGGFAIAGAFRESGLTESIAKSLTGIIGLNEFVVVSILTATMSFVTELTSNMSSTELVLPILDPLAKSMGVKPIFLMMPVTIAASCAFMLPAATAPNSIIIATGRVRLKTMAKTGFVLNLISIVVISIFTYLFVPMILSLSN